MYNEKEKSTIEADYLIFLGIEKNKLELEKNISKAKDILKTNGKILIVFDNKYSIKNMSTDKGIEKIYNNNLYTLEEVLELLDKNGLTNRKMYYPLNDYIFTGIYEKGEEVIVEFKQKLSLAPNKYTLSFSCTRYNAKGELEVLSRKYDALLIDISSNKDCVGLYRLDSDIKIEKQI